MSNKTYLYIFAVVVVIGIVYYVKKEMSIVNMFGKQMGDAEASVISIPTLSEIMTKGYDETEANQILTALEAGKDINY